MLVTRVGHDLKGLGWLENIEGPKTCNRLTIEWNLNSKIIIKTSIVRLNLIIDTEKFAENFRCQFLLQMTVGISFNTQYLNIKLTGSVLKEIYRSRTLDRRS